MRLFAKINRGLILTVIVVIAISAYLIVIGVIRETQKADIKRLCEDYIETEAAYHMLPEQYRGGTKISSSELNGYIESMKKDIKKSYIDNQYAYMNTLNNLESILTEQSKGTFLIKGLTKDITSLSISFYNDTVTVTVYSTVEYQGDNGTSFPTADTITLSKENDVWKIVYANLSYPDFTGKGQYPDKGMIYSGEGM